MDPRTLAVLMVVSGFECSLLFFSSAMTRRKLPSWNYPPSIFWGSGTLVNTIGMVALLYQGRASAWFSVVFAGSMLILGLFLILVGIRLLVNRPLSLARYSLFWILYVLFAVVFTFILPSTPVRVVLFSFVAAGFYIESGILLISKEIRRPGSFAPLIAVTFFLLSAFFLGRAAVNVFWPQSSIFARNSINTVTLLVSHTGLLAWSLGLMLLQNRKNEWNLERAYEEKGVLLRELQHRVKNSLSVIAGLVSLESSRIEDPPAKSALEDLQGRIEAVGALYDQLFKTGETEQVALDLYLKTIAESLFSSMAAASRGVSLDTSLAAERIDTKRAIPLGIVVNELLTDCLKYAFPGGRTGNVRLSLERDGESLALEIRDDGVGLPEGFTAGSGGGLGLVLVEMLSEQAGGNFTMERVDPGTRFVVRFPR